MRWNKAQIAGTLLPSFSPHKSEELRSSPPSIMKLNRGTKRSYSVPLYFILWHFILSHFFPPPNWRMWQPSIKWAYGTIFPTTFSHFIHVLLDFGNTRNILNQYFSICYGDLWSVISNVTIVIVLECHQPHPYKIANLKDIVYVLTAPMTISPPPSDFFPPWDTLILKLGHLITL